MSVTVLIQGRNGVTRWQPGKSWLTLPILILIIAISIVQYFLDQFSSQQTRFDDERIARQAQQQQVENLKHATESQLAILAAHIARIQAEMTRIEAMGQQVAETYQLEDQFDFSTKVGVGGLSEIGHNIKLEQLIEEMDDMIQRMGNANIQMPILETMATNLHIQKERYISGKPINKGWLSSPYGFRNDPFNGRRTMHKGIDFAGSEGADVIATAGGVVTWASNMFGYGNLVEIDHGNGMKTRYGHNKAIHVSVGDIVSKGSKIAIMGSTGRSTGPHVHYEVLRGGQQINPSKYVHRKANN